MNFPGRVYRGRQGTYLAIYNFFPDVMMAAPTSVADKTQRIAHVQYSEGGKRSGIDVFLLRQEQEIPEINLTRRVITRESVSEEVDVQQDICYKLVKGVNPEVIELIRRDIFRYCKRPATTSLGTKIEYHDKIIPITSLKIIEPKMILTPGKPEFVPSCGLEANIDFSRGCVTGWLPEEGASFDGSTFTNFFLSPWGECTYCYAKPKHKSFPKTIYNIDKLRLKEELLGDCRLTVGSDERLGRPVKVLRFGKRTEAASKYTLDSFVLTLETCAETGTRGVVTTKFLEYSPEIAKLLRKTNSVRLCSAGFDELEPGACEHGCTNDWRIEQAIKYKEAGVNSIIYLLTLAHAPLGKREKRILEVAKQHSLPVQLLPMRFGGKDLCRRVTGDIWGELKDFQQPEFSGRDISHQGTYEQMHQNKELVARIIHPDWLDIIGDNSGLVRMCHHNSKTTWCGNCYLNSGFTIKTPPRSLKTIGGRFKTKGKAKGRKLPFKD